MKKLALVVCTMLGLILVISIFIYSRLISSWPEASQEAKKVDCYEAIKSVQFRERVFAEAEEINALSLLFSNNIEQILTHNQVAKESKNNPIWQSNFDLDLKNLGSNLPVQIAASADSIFQEIDKNLIAAVKLYIDGSIMYSIYDTVIVNEPRNYRVFHNLYYRKKIEPVIEMGPELKSLIKDTLSPKLMNTQYCIKIESYIGW